MSDPEVVRLISWGMQLTIHMPGVIIRIVTPSVTVLGLTVGCEDGTVVVVDRSVEEGLHVDTAAGLLG
jgi:hypothetical protein